MRDFFAARDFDGVNVTIPKRAVLPLLDCIDRRAARIGAVNTVVRGADGRLTGYQHRFRRLFRRSARMRTCRFAAGGC